jgi:hypothetical protein
MLFVAGYKNRVRSFGDIVEFAVAFISIKNVLEIVFTLMPALIKPLTTF